MSVRFVPLSCPNCGAKLEVYEDMTRFACGFCGTEVAAERRGGTVLLKAMTEAIRKVQVGTDKTAAELAIVRLSRDLEAANASIQGIRDKSGRDTTPGCLSSIAGLIAMALLVGVIPADLKSLGMVLGLGLGVWAYIVLSKSKQKRTEIELAPLIELARQLQRKIHEQRIIADS